MGVCRTRLPKPKQPSSVTGDRRTKSLVPKCDRRQDRGFPKRTCEVNNFYIYEMAGRSAPGHHFFLIFMNKILIATSNQSKADEYRQLLSSLPVEVVTAKDLGLHPPEETGSSVEENALLKARAYFAASNLPTISDDGAFEIDALDGRPGIYGKRWVNGTEDVTDEEIIAHTLKEMKDVPDDKRQARMHIAVVFIDAAGKEHIAESDINGVITRDVHAYTPGFPYRGIFYIPELGKMYGELTLSEHAAIGHRQKAFQKLLPFIA